MTRLLPESSVRSYRARLLLGMMLVIIALTILGIFLAERKVTIETRRDFLHDFQNKLAALQGVQDFRHAVLAERLQALASRPRIHAALEDNALDLLYPSAGDELREMLEPQSGTSVTPGNTLSARFYRFLDSNGKVIRPLTGAQAGTLQPAEERQLSLPSLNRKEQSGYLLSGNGPGAAAVYEILAMPITSTDTGETIAALVLGFKPVEFGYNRSDHEIKSGVWENGRLYLPALDKEQRDLLDATLARMVALSPRSANSFQATISGAPQLLFYKQLNAGSLYPPAYEIAVYPLTRLFARQRQIRSRVVGSGAALLLVGLIASHFLSRRLSVPVEKLAVTAEQNRVQRAVAEKTLRLTSVELQRSARFSADASHQLKTPVTVLRAGIEALLTREGFTPQVYDELSSLLHHTYRITGVVDDLLLLSSMDAGRLRIQFDSVNLSQLLEEWLDDMSALPDGLSVQLKTNFPPELSVSGEKRYISLVVANLLENANKYNTPGGEIRVTANEEEAFVILTIENTGPPIPSQAREHIFERFHRGTMGENVPGHGLGLNLARELARLQGGDVRLVRSDEDGTVFEVRFCRVARSQSETAAS